MGALSEEVRTEVLCGRICDLEVENAKLREQITRLQSEWESEKDYADQMEAKEKIAVAENEKLRELVAHYEYAVTVYDVKPVEVLEWSARCGKLRKELGMEEE